MEFDNTFLSNWHDAISRVRTGYGAPGLTKSLSTTRSAARRGLSEIRGTFR